MVQYLKILGFFLEWERAFISLMRKPREFLKMAYIHLDEEVIHFESNKASFDWSHCFNVKYVIFSSMHLAAFFSPLKPKGVMYKYLNKTTVLWATLLIKLKPLPTSGYHSKGWQNFSRPPSQLIINNFLSITLFTFKPNQIILFKHKLKH